ncbi:hypothetical protein VCV18_008177 [Metarhizium anisopliae]
MRLRNLVGLDAQSPRRRKPELAAILKSRKKSFKLSWIENGRHRQQHRADQISGRDPSNAARGASLRVELPAFMGGREEYRCRAKMA